MYQSYLCVSVVFSIVVWANSNIAQMTGTRGGKELKYHTGDTLILDVLRMDVPTMEGLESDDCFRSENVVTDVTYAGTYTCISCG